MKSTLPLEKPTRDEFQRKLDSPIFYDPIFNGVGYIITNLRTEGCLTSPITYRTTSIAPDISFLFSVMAIQNKMPLTEEQFIWLFNESKLGQSTNPERVSRDTYTLTLLHRLDGDATNTEEIIHRFAENLYNRFENHRRGSVKPLDLELNALAEEIERSNKENPLERLSQYLIDKLNVSFFILNIDATTSSGIYAVTDTDTNDYVESITHAVLLPNDNPVI